MKAGLHFCCALILLPVSGIAAAQSTNNVVLNATYLGAPTDWCGADQGVPLIIKMDGPDVVSPLDSFPVTVRERRGTETSGIVFESQSTNSLDQPHDLTSAEAIGRFSADVRACQSPWTALRVSGTWRLTSNDAAELDTGRFENKSLGYSGLPFFNSVSRYSDAMFATLGERQIFTTDTPDVTLSQTFAAESDKE